MRGTVARSVDDAEHPLSRGEPQRRWEVEARLLAGQSDQEIAARVDLTAEVVGAYESLFFSVRDRLRASDWIIFTAIGPRIDNTSADDLETIWKSFGYHHGPQVLDVLIALSDLEAGRRPSAAVEPGLADLIKLAVLVSTSLPRLEDARKWLRLKALGEWIDQRRSESNLSSSLVGRVDIGRAEVRLEPTPASMELTVAANPSAEPTDSGDATLPPNPSAVEEPALLSTG